MTEPTDTPKTIDKTARGIAAASLVLSLLAYGCALAALAQTAKP